MSSTTRKGGKKGSSSKRSAAMDVDEGRAMAEMPLGKQLAHTDKKIRDQAIRNLEAFLSQSSGEKGSYVPIAEKEMAKLWKGLFYCFWMSDKPLVQQGLATDLANLLLRINPVDSGAGAQLTASLGFLDGFWAALVREWNGIDRLRLDKYYMLIRRYINATFRLLAREDWSAEAIAGVNKILSGPRGPMTWQDKSVPTSLATHIADVYLEELDKVLSEPEMGAAPLVVLLEPHILLLARTPGKIVHQRLMTVLFSPLLAALKEDEDDEDEDERPAKRRKGASSTAEFAAIAEHSAAEVGGAVAEPKAVRAALLKAMFKAAAAEEAVESNRRRIYAVVREEGDDDDE